MGFPEELATEGVVLVALLTRFAFERSSSSLRSTSETEVAIDRALVAEAADITRERVVELGVMSDFAVSKFVEPSLVVDIVELGRERPDGGRKVEGPATVFRIVGA